MRVYSAGPAVNAPLNLLDEQLRSQRLGEIGGLFEPARALVLVVTRNRDEGSTTSRQHPRNEFGRLSAELHVENGGIASDIIQQAKCILHPPGGTHYLEARVV